MTGKTSCCHCTDSAKIALIISFYNCNDNCRSDLHHNLGEVQWRSVHLDVLPDPPTAAGQLGPVPQVQVLCAGQHWQLPRICSSVSWYWYFSNCLCEILSEISTTGTGQMTTSRTLLPRVRRMPDSNTKIVPAVIFMYHSDLIIVHTAGQYYKLLSSSGPDLLSSISSLDVDFNSVITTLLPCCETGDPQSWIFHQSLEHH